MRRKPKPPSPPPVEKAPEKLARPFADALAGLAKRAAEEARAPRAAEPTPKPDAGSKPKPSPKAKPAPAADGGATRAVKPKDALGAYGYDDRVAFHQAFADVRPLPRRKQPVVGGPDPEREAVRARAAEVDASARARLEALVAEGVRFVVERDSEGGVAGRRVNVADRVLDALYGSKLSPTRRLDLHGMVADDARRAIVAFVREHQDRGARDVLLVHGKGLHSEGGSGVLGEVVVQALTTSAAAVRVEAFITAPARLGGAGATLVRLAPRTAS